MNRKAIVLLSGGLDSILAVKLMMEQGIEVVPVHYYIEFASCGGGEGPAQKAARELGVPLKIFDITKEYLEVFKNPKHGYGANINPCIDCKIFMLMKAKEYMKEVGASFLVTGEVLGERPMSQRRDALNIIERDAGVRGILLRPLSAKLLDETIPEREGIVDRTRLEDIVGRSRKRQFELAAKFGVKEYPNPAGGCLLTDPGFTRRVKDLIAHDQLSIENLRLLKTGRHYRLHSGSKLIVGRNDKENDIIEAQAVKEDIVLRVNDRPSPISILKGQCDDESFALAASIVAYHTKYRNEPMLDVAYWNAGSEDRSIISVKPALLEEFEAYRI